MAVNKPGKRSAPTEINFNLNVKAALRGGKVTRLSFDMDLNPQKRILAIDEYLSSRADLAAIFEDLNRVLAEIDKRSEVYNSMISYRPVKGFNPKYEENIKPTFGKIVSIEYRHESPGAANVCYARRYNGDLEPPSI